MDNTITVEGFTFEVNTKTLYPLVELSLIIKSIPDSIKQALSEALPLKKEALKYARHSKKRERLTKWIKFAEEMLALD